MTTDSQYQKAFLRRKGVRATLYNRYRRRKIDAVEL